METTEALTIIIPSAITIVGFIISNIINKRDNVNRLQEHKIEKQLSDLYGIQKDVLELIEELCIMNAYPDKRIKGFKERKKKIESIVFCAGSTDAVKLIAYIHDLVQTGIDDNIEVPFRDLIASFLLLAMQIKYDTTGIKTTPKYWYIGYYTTQKMLGMGDFYHDSIISVNRIVEELELDEFLMINNDELW